MPHLKLINGQPEKYSIGQLRRDNPSVSFPRSIPSGVLSEYSVYEYAVDERPAYNGLSRDIREGDFYQDASGHWRINWNIIDRPLEEASQRVRSRRGELLRETDWVVIMHTEKGTNIPLEWEVYRQALRDITDHVNFPHLAEEDWPVKP